MSFPTAPGESKPHVSPSSMERYFQCGHQWSQIYVDGLRRPPGIAIIRGKSVHKVAEHNFRQKVETRRDLPAPELFEVASQAFDDEIVTAGFELTPEEVGEGARKILGRAKDAVIRMVEAFRHGEDGDPGKAIAPRIQPAMVEQRVRIALKGQPVDLLGVVDVIEEDTYSPVDIKTTGRPKTQRVADTSGQLTWYCVSVQKFTGKMARDCRLEILVDPGDGAPIQVQTLRSRRNRSDMLNMLNRVNTMVKGVQAGIFPPADPGWWGCSPRFCGFWNECPYVNSERLAAAEDQGLT